MAAICPKSKMDKMSSNMYTKLVYTASIGCQGIIVTVTKILYCMEVTEEMSASHLPHKMSLMGAVLSYHVSNCPIFRCLPLLF